MLFQYPTTNLYYCIDSTLYFGNIAENRIASLTLHASDFVSAGIPVYIVPLLFSTSVVEWIVVGITLSCAVFFVWRRKKQSILSVATSIQDNSVLSMNPIITSSAIMPDEENLSQVKEETNIITPIQPAVHFDEREIQVLQLLLKNNRQATATTIEELNAVLGVTKKSNDIQKNQRSAVLKSINGKYKRWQKASVELIKSSKPETDKRSRIYCIAADQAHIITSVAEIHNSTERR